MKALKTLGIIAGSGDFPILVAKGAKKKGVKEIVVAALIGETNKDIELYVDIVVWIELGQLSQMIHTFKNNNCESIVMAGQITPTKLFSKLKFDLRMAKLMAKVKFRGAAPLFGTIAEELLKDGIKLVDSSLFVKDQLAVKGAMTKGVPSKQHKKDIKKGCSLAKSIADLDIGQTIIMKEGAVVAVEAIEGTNETILRAGKIAGSGSIVVKVSKSSQDRRFDIPVVGIETINVMKEAGCSVLVLEKGGAIMLNKSQVVSLAEKYNIAIFGV